jgi:hypothetical protein
MAVAPPSNRQRTGDDRELERRRQPFDQQFQDIPAQRDRHAEIAVQNAVEPDAELHEQRLVEPVTGAQFGNVMRAGTRRDHHRDRVAGSDAQQQEHNDRDAEQRHDRHGDTPENCGRNHHSCGRASLAAARPTSCRHPFLVTRVGCMAPETLGVTFRSALYTMGLNVLQQWDHVPLLCDM